MLGMAFLAVTTAAERDATPAPAGLIPLTHSELRRLFDALVLGATTPSPDHIIRWSIWRRKHQATARHHHYRRRSEYPGLDLRL